MYSMNDMMLLLSMLDLYICKKEPFYRIKKQFGYKYGSKRFKKSIDKIDLNIKCPDCNGKLKLYSNRIDKEPYIHLYCLDCGTAHRGDKLLNNKKEKVDVIETTPTLFDYSESYIEKDVADEQYIDNPLLIESNINDSVNIDIEDEIELDLYHYLIICRISLMFSEREMEICSEDIISNVYSENNIFNEMIDELIPYGLVTRKNGYVSLEKNKMYKLICKNKESELKKMLSDILISQFHLIYQEIMHRINKQLVTPFECYINKDLNKMVKNFLYEHSLNHLVAITNWYLSRNNHDYFLGIKTRNHIENESYNSIINYASCNYDRYKHNINDIENMKFSYSREYNKLCLLLNITEKELRSKSIKDILNYVIA